MNRYIKILNKTVDKSPQDSSSQKNKKKKKKNKTPVTVSSSNQLNVDMPIVNQDIATQPQTKIKSSKLM